MTRWSRVLLVIALLSPSPVRAEPNGWPGWPTLQSLLPKPPLRPVTDPEEELWFDLLERAGPGTYELLDEVICIAKGDGPHACAAKILVGDVRANCSSWGAYAAGTTCESPYQAYAWYQYARHLANVDESERALDALAHVEPALRAHAKELRHARAAVSALVAESRALQAEITAGLLPSTSPESPVLPPFAP